MSNVNNQLTPKSHRSPTSCLTSSDITLCCQLLKSLSIHLPSPPWIIIYYLSHSHMGWDVGCLCRIPGKSTF